MSVLTWLIQVESPLRTLAAEGDVHVVKAKLQVLTLNLISTVKMQVLTLNLAPMP